MDEIVILSFVLWTVVAGLVGVSANGCGRSGAFWGLFTFLTGLVGALVYVVVLVTSRTGEETDGPDDAIRRCPACDTVSDGQPNFCAECGEALSAADDTERASVLRSGARAYCGNCKARVAVDASACDDCGSVLERP